MREDQLKIVIIPTARFNADPISYIRPQRNKFERSPGQSIDVVLRGSVFDGNVLPLDIAKVAQALPKVIPVGRVVYDAYARHPADCLLGARREGRCPTAESVMNSRRLMQALPRRH